MNVEHVFHDGVDGGHEEVMKRLSDWLAADSRGFFDLPESYADGEMCLHVHLGVRLGIGVSVCGLTEHCALFRVRPG